MNVKDYIGECLEKLDGLGIKVLDRKDELIEKVLRMPSDMLADMEKEQILGLLLDYIGEDIGDYEHLSNQVYSFDMEFFDISDMYTNFLWNVQILTDGDISFHHVEEDISQVDLKKGTGIHKIYFQCNGKDYDYGAISRYDWFDSRVLSFIGRVIAKQQTGKYLYCTSDGWQNCILFYNTEEWAKQFQDTFHVLKIKKL